jgi:nucleotide-binding universal stress UspA family protein
MENLERDARARLEGMLSDAQKAKYSVVVTTRTGGAADQILGYLEEQAIDLLVVATAGRGAVARLLMGSVADKLIRTAHCPVLTVHPHDRPKTDSGHRAA